jgi:hypothetical protein
MYPPLWSTLAPNIWDDLPQLTVIALVFVQTMGEIQCP